MAARQNGRQSVGDGRDELILRSEDSSELRIYVTPYPTEVRMVTLMSDPVYRAASTRYNFLRACTIYGGSNEIQKNVLAKVLIGL